MTTGGTLAAVDADVVGLTDELATVVGAVGVPLLVVGFGVEVDGAGPPVAGVVAMLAAVVATCVVGTTADDGGGELSGGDGTDAGADTEPVGAVGAAVNVVGPASVDVHDANRTALTVSPANRPRRRSCIVRPPLSFAGDNTGAADDEHRSSTSMRRC